MRRSLQAILPLVASLIGTAACGQDYDLVIANGRVMDPETGFDQVANVGITEQKQFLKLVRRQDVRLFTFIMGNSANEPLLQAMTSHSGGFAVAVSNSDDVVAVIYHMKDRLDNLSDFFGP